MPAQKKRSRWGSVGCLFLFALPFAGVGVFMGYLTATAIVDWYSMRSWVRVDAELVAVNLREHSDSDSTTYEVTASYRYFHDTREYTGSRVGLHGGADNIGDYHRDLYSELSSRRGKTVSCFVDPDDPSQAVLHRGLRFELVGFYLLFVILFGGAGFGIMATGLYGSRALKREEALKALHPEEPWLHKQEWQEGRIRSSTRAAFIASAVFAGTWNLISLPVLVFAHEQVFDPDNRIALIALMFPAVGAGLAFWAGRSFVRWRKFGESTFEMRTLPGVIGGPLEGTLRTSVDVRPENGFEVTLSSIRRYRSGSGKNRRTTENVLWQSSYHVARDRSHGGVPLAFHVPFECSPTDVDDTDNQKIWRLEVAASVRGVDYHVQFDVPVFRTEYSSTEPAEEAGANAAPARAYRIEVPLAQQLIKSGARVEQTTSGKRFVFPMARHLGTAAGLSVFFVVWSAICVGLWVSDAPRLFPWVFGLFDALLLLGVLDVWFFSSHIEVRPGGLTYAAGLFGGRRRHLSSSDVEKVGPKRGMQSGNKLFYQLEIRERDGSARVAAKRLPDLDTAERLAKEIESILIGGVLP